MCCKIGIEIHTATDYVRSGDDGGDGGDGGGGRGGAGVQCQHITGRMMPTFLVCECCVGVHVSRWDTSTNSTAVQELCDEGKLFTVRQSVPTQHNERGPHRQAFDGVFLVAWGGG